MLRQQQEALSEKYNTIVLPEYKKKNTNLSPHVVNLNKIMDKNMERLEKPQRIKNLLVKATRDAINIEGPSTQCI